MKERLFDTAELGTLLEVKTPTLSQWFCLEFVEPSIAANGGGNRHKYTKLDVQKIAVFKMLVDAGVDRRFASKLLKRPELIEAIDRWLPETETYMLLAYNGKTKRFQIEVPTNPEADFERFYKTVTGPFITSDFREIKLFPLWVLFIDLQQKMAEM